MNSDQIKLLEENGWVVECKSPIEVRHTESGSFVTGLAVYYVIQSLERERNLIIK